MEAVWQADRSALRDLLHTRPDLSLKEMARRLNRSYTWVKDWAKRLAQAPPNDWDVLNSRSRARHTPAPEWDPLVLRRLEQLRLPPPEGLQRTPGRHPPCCITCPATANCKRRGVVCPNPPARSGRCSSSWGCFPKSPWSCIEKSRCLSQCERFKRTSKASVRSCLTQVEKGRNSIEARPAISLMRGARPGFWRWFGAISMRHPTTVALN